jgi:hypothetical protein
VTQTLFWQPFAGIFGTGSDAKKLYLHICASFYMYGCVLLVLAGKDNFRVVKVTDSVLSLFGRTLD